MPIIKKPLRPGSGAGKTLLATRRGNILVAGASAILAAGLLIIFIQSYRSSVAAEGEAAKVLVATGLIEQGSSGEALSDERKLRTTSVRADQLKAGAVTDASLLRGKVAVQDVLPGQQLVATDFAPARNTVRANLRGEHRAINIPVDAIHGMTGSIATGDRVDVLAGFSAETGGVSRPIVKQILKDVLVLRAGGAVNAEGQSLGQGVVLRVGAKDVADVAYASDNGKLWLILRPGAGVREAPEDLVTLESVLFGKTIKLDEVKGR